MQGERRHPRFIFGDIQNAIRTSIKDILKRGFLQYVCVCLLKRWKYSKEICMDGNNVVNDYENGLLSSRIYSSPAVARVFLLRLGLQSLPRSLDTTCVTGRFAHGQFVRGKFAQNGLQRLG